MTNETRRQTSSDVRPKVLVVAPYFPPAVLAGGPIRSISGIVDRLHSDFNFHVLAVNHDLQQTSTLEGVISGTWTRQPKCFVRFEADRVFTFWNYRRWIAETNPSIVYLNTFFSPRFSIFPLLAVLTSRGKRPAVILAPRGQLMREARNLKSTKKRAYLVVYRLLRLPRRTIWHATSTVEEEDLRILFGSRITVTTVSEVRAQSEEASLELPTKRVGELRVIFLSRVSPKKNLDFAIERLAHVKGRVHFTIVGPGEDTRYLEKCRELVRSLPTSVTVDFAGPVEHAQVAEAIASHHLFFLPSLSENYGHAIVEALSCPRPVLIGDRTPWHDLERRGLGSDLPLTDTHAFEAALQKACDQDEQDFIRQVSEMPPLVAGLLREPALLDKYRSMFRSVPEAESPRRTNRAKRSADN